jgi:hypothetical protein
MQHHAKASNERAQVFSTSGFKKGTVFGVPVVTHSHNLETADALYRIVAKFSKTDASIAEMLSVAANEEERTVVAQFAAERRAELLAEIRAAEDLVARDRKAVADRRANVLAVPPATDAAQAVLDGEIRRRVAEMPERQLQALQSELHKSPRLLAALARDPLPTPTAQHAVGIWQAKVATERADELAEIEGDGMGADEIGGGLAALRGAVA